MLQESRRAKGTNVKPQQGSQSFLIMREATTFLTLSVKDWIVASLTTIHTPAPSGGSGPGCV